MTTEEKSPTYRDAQLHKLMKQLRADVRTNPTAKATLAKIETRLRYVLKVVTSWDHTHAKWAELYINLGDIPKANTAATLVFDDQVRADLLRRCFIGLTDDSDALAEAVALDREVLN